MKIDKKQTTGIIVIALVLACFIAYYFLDKAATKRDAEAAVKGLSSPTII